jgi:hypothetical protein
VLPKHPGRLLLLPTRDFVPVTPQSRWHSLTRNWPVFALRDCSVAAKSTRPPRMGVRMWVRRAGGAYTPQGRKLPLSSTSLFEQPLERDSRTGGRRVNSLPAFARVARRMICKCLTSASVGPFLFSDEVCAHALRGVIVRPWRSPGRGGPKRGFSGSFGGNQ